MSSPRKLSHLIESTVTPGEGNLSFFTDNKMNSNTMSTRTLLKEIFTEDEWNAIYDAMADYQDHGETETDLSQSVQSKITELFS